MTSVRYSLYKCIVMTLMVEIRMPVWHQLAPKKQNTRGVFHKGFTNVSYDQLTRCRSHELILLIWTVTLLGLHCVRVALRCTTLWYESRVALVRENWTYKLDTRTSLWRLPRVHNSETSRLTVPVRFLRSPHYLEKDSSLNRCMCNSFCWP